MEVNSRLLGFYGLPRGFRFQEAEEHSGVLLLGFSDEGTESGNVPPEVWTVTNMVIGIAGDQQTYMSQPLGTNP